MDLTSLQSTLPLQGQNSQESQYAYPPAALMSAFKQAALSVTTLYKCANTEIEHARKQGYQDALDDLLHLINSDRISLNSEVTKIREWGLARQRRGNLDGENGTRNGESAVDESEDERSQARTAGSSSPIRDPTPPPPPPPPTSLSATQQPSLQPTLCTSMPTYEYLPTPPAPPQAHRLLQKESSLPFTFRASHGLPRHTPPPPKIPTLEDIELPDTMPDSPLTTALGDQSLHHIHHGSFSPTSNRTPSGAWKRRFPLDFLELAAMAEKEKTTYAGIEFGGGKRGRMA